MWTEKSYEESTLNSTSQTSKEWLSNREDTRLNIEKNVLKVDIKPNKEVLDALIQTLKKSYITYAFDPLVALFLEKPERYEIVLKAKENHCIYCVFPENLPFISYTSACDYLIAKHWDKFFYSEKIEIEPPKGQFTSVSRCGFTGVLLGPPNYHIYNDFLKEHYEESLAGKYSWKEFVSGIKNEKDPKQVSDWLEYMKSAIRYRLKSNPELYFMNRLSARKYLVKNCTDNVIDEVLSFKLNPDRVSNLPDPILKNLVQQELEREYKTHSRMASWCRRRMHKADFHIYRKDKYRNNIVYVCSIKRRIRDESTQFSDEIKKIIDAIEKHQNSSMDRLMRFFFNISDKEKTVETYVEAEKISNFKRNLLLLIRKGYVSQYENGTIYISPKQHHSAIQNQKKYSNSLASV